MVFDRVEMLKKVAPDEKKWPELYYDKLHFNTPEPYHAFNWLLLNRLPPWQTK
jgi:hypothetical protein